MSNNQTNKEMDGEKNTRTLRLQWQYLDNQTVNQSTNDRIDLFVRSSRR